MWYHYRPSNTRLILWESVHSKTPWDSFCSTWWQVRAVSQRWWQQLGHRHWCHHMIQLVKSHPVLRSLLILSYCLSLGVPGGHFPFFIICIYLYGWSGTKSAITEAIYWPAVPTQDDWWLMMIVEQLVKWMSGRGNWSTWRKPAAVPLCPAQILHDLTWPQTQAIAVENWQLTAWAMAWLFSLLVF
jgi:hypothetical protein